MLLIDNLLLLERNKDIEVLNTNNGQIDRTIEGPGESQGGMCVSGDMLFLSDFRNKNIQVLRVNDGAYIQTFDGNGKFKRPTQLCIFGDYLFVADIIGNNNSIIHVLNATDGSYVRSIGDGKLGYPSAMLVSGQEIFVLESNSRIQVLNVNDGSYIRTMANERGSQPGQFNFPSDICVLGQEIFVTDSFSE